MINNSNQAFSNQELVIVLVLTILIIFLSNSLSVFYFAELIQDDILWYVNILADIKPTSKRLLLPFFIEWPMWNMMFWQPNLTHLFYILFYMVPVSFLSYYLYRKYFGIWPIPAFSAAVLPNILSHMFLLPAYTNGSYIIYITLIGLLGLLSGLRFLEYKRKRFFVLSVSLFLFIGLLSEYPAMLLLPYVAIFIFYSGLNARVALLSACYLSISIYITLRMIEIASKATSINLYDSADMFIRLKTGIHTLIPFSYSTTQSLFIFIGLLLLMVIAFSIYISNDRKELHFDTTSFAALYSRRKYIVLLFSLCVIWLLSVYSYTLVSHWLAPRYFYLAAFPFSLLLVLTIYPFVGFLFRFNYLGVAVTFLCLLAFSGVARNVNYFNYQGKLINIGSIYFDELQNRNFPTNSQLYIVDNKRQHNGVWYYNRSYIQYHSKRLDLTGHIGDNLFNYDNPFIGRRTFDASGFLRGLEFKAPFFAFKIDRDKEIFLQYRYLLKWDNPSKNSTWSLFKLHQNDGFLVLINSGKGWDDYIHALSAINSPDFDPEFIALGGYPTQNTINRLKLTDADLVMLKKVIEK